MGSWEGVLLDHWSSRHAMSTANLFRAFRAVDAGGRDRQLPRRQGLRALTQQRWCHSRRSPSDLSQSARDGQILPTSRHRANSAK